MSLLDFTVHWVEVVHFIYFSPSLIPNMFPNYIRAPNGAEAKPVSQLYKGQSSHNSQYLRR